MQLIKLRRRVAGGVILAVLAAIAGGTWMLVSGGGNDTSGTVLHTASSYINGSPAQRCAYYAGKSGSADGGAACAALERRLSSARDKAPRLSLSETAVSSVRVTGNTAVAFLMPASDTAGSGVSGPTQLNLTEVGNKWLIKNVVVGAYPTGSQSPSQTTSTSEAPVTTTTPSSSPTPVTTAEPSTTSTPVSTTSTATSSTPSGSGATPAAFTPGDHNPNDASASSCEQTMEVGPQADCTVAQQTASDLAQGVWSAPGSDTVSDGGTKITFDCTQIGQDTSQTGNPGIYSCIAQGDSQDWFKFESA